MHPSKIAIGNSTKVPNLTILSSFLSHLQAQKKKIKVTQRQMQYPNVVGHKYDLCMFCKMNGKAISEMVFKKQIYSLIFLTFSVESVKHFSVYLSEEEFYFSSTLLNNRSSNVDKRSILVKCANYVYEI